METKIMNIFYGADSLPYKDSARTVHYPVVGTEFEGASNTTEIHFYVDRIGGVLEPTWVANTKLPNGKVGYKKLEYDTDSENGEHYLILTLSQFYTQSKGDIYISLNGFNGGVSLEQDEDDNYILVGTPTIRTTGCVRLTINYAVQPLPSDIYEFISLDDILAYISGLASDDFVKTRFVPRFSINTTNEDYTTNSIASVLDDFGVVPNFGAKTFVLELTRQNNSGVAYLITIQDAGTPTYVKVIDLISFNTGSTSNYDISTKTFSDLIGSDLSWTKYVEQTITGNRVYGTTSSGQQTIFPVDENEGNVVRRDSNDQISVPLTPSANGQATSKKYVDDNIDSERTYVDTKLADKQDKLIAGANITISGNVISATGGSGQSMRTEVVNELPTTGENGVIYLVPKDSGTTPDIYDEYVWVEDNNDFEFIGTTAIDLSDYYTKTQTDTLLTTKPNIISTNGIDDVSDYANAKVGDIIVDIGGFVGTIKTLTKSGDTITKIEIRGLENNNKPTTYIYENNNWTYSELDYVDFTSAQTISGLKDNTSGLKTNKYTLENNGTQLNIKYEGNTVLTIDRTKVVPNSYYGLVDVGDTTNKVRDLYLSRNITDGTNSMSVADIFNSTFNVINASDIVANTLTQAQYDLITNGKMTLIMGSFLSRANGLVLNLTDFGTELAGTFISGTYRNVIRINKTTHVCFRANDTLRYIDLASILKFNGKEVPAYPTTNTSPQVLTIGANGGNLSWQDHMTEWYGTQAQYDNLGTYDSNTIYNILES